MLNMRKSLRLKTAKETVVDIKDLQKQIITRTAQRKFAVNVSTSSDLKEELNQTRYSNDIPETKDFIKFLCLRDSSHLPSNLETFTNPPTSNNENSIIFEEQNLQCTEKTLDMYAPNCKKKRIDCSAKQLSVQEITNITTDEPSTEDLVDFFHYIENSCKSSIVCIKPSSEWKSVSYIQESLQFAVETSHVHRLKYSDCKSFLTLQCLRRCFEKDGLSKMKMPCIGLCEVDLPHLMEVVASFGGVDSVNSDQNWRALAEQLNIPKSASRRGTQLEKIYMKYILPYILLPETERARIILSVKNETKSEVSKCFISSKRVCLETFHRMACNASYYYGDYQTAKEIEEQFWEIVHQGDRYEYL
jgi:ARID/BRIGHT DNA binding domain.